MCITTIKIKLSSLYGRFKCMDKISVRVINHTNMCGVVQNYNGDWVDLLTAEDTSIESGGFKYIPLCVSIELPKGYEALVVPRSSTFKRYGVIQANSIGVIDESYNGDGDVWHFPAYATRNTFIPAGTRICQFRIIKHQPDIEFNFVKRFGNKNRGGLGSTGL